MLSATSQASTDPLVQAYQDIQQLELDINNLTNKAKTQELLDVAKSKYNTAVASKQDMDNKKSIMDSNQITYDTAVSDEATATTAKNNAQAAADTQQAVRDSAYTNLQNKQNALDIANINLSTAQANLQSASSQGLQYTVYNLVRTWPSIATPDSIICSGTWNSSSMQLPVCGNRYENIVVRFTGTITVPSHWTSTYFAGYTDDGFRMYVNGSLAVNNWVEQGARWSSYSPVYDVSVNKTLNVEIWWYNGGGPGSYHLGWAIPGGWTGAGCDYTGGWGVGFSCNLNTFSSGSGPTATQTAEYNNAVTAQANAQSEYNAALSTYNTENNLLNQYNQNLTTADQNLTTANQNLTTATENLTNSTTDYNNSITTYENALLDTQNAIVATREEYNKQWDFEEKQRVAAAIATALANQPQPTPEPTVKPSPEPTIIIDPTPEPSPEQTKPSDPTPEPSPETTPSEEPTQDPTPEPSVQPSPEPSPQPSDITPDPTPEPTATPVEPSPEPSPDNSNIKELIPKQGQGTSEDLSRVIANLTSKDNVVVKLSPEQMAAVSKTLSALSPEAKVEVAASLGVKTNEIAILAESAKDNPAVAAAIVSFAEKAKENAEAPMPYTIADAITEAAAELFLDNPLAVFEGIDLEKLSDPTQWGKDMTDDQREKAQEVVIPVILVSNIVASVGSVLTRRL